MVMVVTWNIDLVIMRRADAPREDEQARMMRPLWPHLGEATVVEYKSPDEVYQRTDLVTLCASGLAYFAEHYRELEGSLADAMGALLVVPHVTQELRDDAASLGLRWEVLEPGYFRLSGYVFPIFVVSAIEAAEATDDDWLRLVSGQPVKRAETMAWYNKWLEEYEKNGPDPAQEEEAEMEEMRDELLASMTPGERVQGLAPEDLLAGLSPEQVEDLLDLLARLTPHERLFALPDDVLRSLSADYIDTLPAPVRAILHNRLAASATG